MTESTVAGSVPAGNCTRAPPGPWTIIGAAEADVGTGGLCAHAGCAARAAGCAAWALPTIGFAPREGAAAAYCVQGPSAGCAAAALAPGAEDKSTGIEAAETKAAALSPGD